MDTQTDTEEAMCDIVTLKCVACGATVETHIGDYSVGRGNVYPYCPQPACREAAMTRLLGIQRAIPDLEIPEDTYEAGAMYIVFSNSPFPYDEDKDEDEPSKPRPEEGKAYLFLVDMPRHVHTNF